MLSALAVAYYFLLPIGFVVERPVDYLHIVLLVATALLVSLTAAYVQRLRFRRCTRSVITTVRMRSTSQLSLGF